MAAANLVHAEGVYVSLGGLPILRDVHVDVAAGEAVALIGGNGSGKSTLIRAVMGLVPHQEGVVELFGERLPGFHDWQRVGYVPQLSTVNVAGATVREIASAGRLAHRRPFQWLSAADRAARDHALEQVGLGDRAKWPFSALSGGQKQRVLIARALAAKPDLLVMDEPLAGVDLHSQAGLAELLRGFRDSGLGLLVVLHERGAMGDVLDRTVTLCDGRVVTGENHLVDTEHDHPAPEPSLLGLSDPIAGAAS